MKVFATQPRKDQLRTGHSLNRNLIIGSSALLVLLILFSGVRRSSVLNSSIDAQNLDEAEKRISISHLNSPGEIERYINDHDDDTNLDAIWAKFGVVTESGPPGRCGCREGDCPGMCKAQVIQISSGGVNPEYDILRICYAGGSDCWFLLFKKEGDWKFMNAVGFQENKYEGVKHRIVSCRDKRWLVVKLQTGGTGFLGSEERWLDIGNHGLSEVLSYPVSGHSVQGEADDYELNSKVPSEALGDDCAIAVHYEIFRDFVLRPKFHWTTSVKRKLQFVWDASAERFVLDMVNSDLGDAQLDPVLGYLFRHGYLK